ncbi:MAG: hypothetical protein HY372_00265 [Candidatus Andersenbacteria bacterium]|nr:hypothetical protein [Candidatus Andersenbacteria bacterium]
MDQLKELIDLYSESRMQYGHLTIIFLYGLIAVFAICPFLGLIFFPPAESLDVAGIGPFYWQRLADVNITGLLLYIVVAFNAGLLLSSMQQLTKSLYWKWIIWPVAKIFGKGEDCAIIERDLVTSRKFADKGEYTDFLQWLEPQKDRRRVRGWDWFISNAYRTLSFLVFIFWGLNVFVILLAIWLPRITALTLPLNVTLRSWAMVTVVAVLFVLLIPGDIHHYRVRAEGDSRLFKAYQAAKTPAPRAGELTV